MLSYLTKRILLFVPTLLVIALFAFGLSKLSPDDPVLQYENEDGRTGVYSKRDLIRLENQYRVVRAKLGIDKPNFYFSIHSQAFPDTLYRFLLLEEREALKNLISTYGNWPDIERYFNQIKEFEYRVLELPSEVSRSKMAELKKGIRDLYDEYKEEVILSKISKIEKIISKDSLMNAELGAYFKGFQGDFQNVIANATPQKLYIPSFNWHGFDNQFHNWFFNFIKGDFGYSLTTRQPASKRIIPALKWTLLINLIAIFLAYLISIPIGVKAAVRKGERFDKVSSLTMFTLYSLPSFWLGTMLLIFFTTKAYGMEIFHGVWAGNMKFENFSTNFWDTLGYLVLPVFCITYPAFAFLSRQMRGSMKEVLQQDYIRTARAKGLPEKTVIWRHAFRNALFPLITIFASVFPASIVGSVAIEQIFNIPGMGKLILDSCLSYDWPIVFSVLMLGAILTLVGILIADILYAFFDPRISYKKT
jgi:peptide/nickel transport system permease protein